MPNDCWNLYTVVGNPDDIQRLYQNELERLTTVASPCSGCVVQILKQTDKGIRFRFWSGEPNKEWMERMLEEYPSLWMKNYWSEEGGYAGVIVGGMLYGTRYDIQELTWDDVVLEDEFHEFRV
jgi:hypothetical protein